MSERMKFQPLELSNVRLNARENACAMDLADKRGNIVELVMTHDFGAHLVATTQSAFLAIEARKMLDDAAAEESFRAYAAMVSVPFEARANPLGTPLAPVLVTIGPGAPFEQSFGLTVERAEALAEALQTAASRIRATSDFSSSH